MSGNGCELAQFACVVRAGHIESEKFDWHAGKCFLLDLMSGLIALGETARHVAHGLREHGRRRARPIKHRFAVCGRLGLITVVFVFGSL